MRKWFYRTLSIRGNYFIAPEHTRKCLKNEYLGRIEYDFQLVLQALETIKIRFLLNKYLNKVNACVPLKKGSAPLNFNLPLSQILCRVHAAIVRCASAPLQQHGNDHASSSVDFSRSAGHQAAHHPHTEAGRPDREGGGRSRSIGIEDVVPPPFPPPIFHRTLTNGAVGKT